MIWFRRRAQGSELPPIETRHLHLQSITPALLEAEERGLGDLGKALGANLPPDWPPEHWEPHVRAHILAQFTAQPETVGWHRYMLLEGRPRLLVGCLGAFPCAAGDAELGYSVVNSHQRHGLGTEAANGLVDWLLAQPSIRSVSAQTYETVPASIKVMERCGMRHIGPGDEAGTVRYRRWR